MFLVMGLEPEFLRCAHCCVHWTLCKDRRDRLGRQQIQVETTRTTAPVCGCPLNGDLRHLRALDALGFVERQEVLLAALHLIWLLLLFLITRILRFNSFDLFNLHRCF